MIFRKKTPIAPWQFLDEQQSDEAVMTQVMRVFAQCYQDHFREELLVNHQFPIEIRAFRHTDIWRIFLLLTPWMLARVFLPKLPPDIPMPPGWAPEERLQVPFQVIGPALPLAILGGREQAHLNYHPELGHYFIQPLIQSMTQFNVPDQAFEAWNAVIRTRDAAIQAQQKRCDWQQEVSRREFFAKVIRQSSSKTE